MSARPAGAVVGLLCASLLVASPSSAQPSSAPPGLEEAVLRAAAAPGRVRVVVQTQDAAGRPATDVVLAGGRADAERVLRSAAARPGTVSVEVDSVLRRTAGSSGTDPLRPRQWALRGLAAPALWSVPGGSDVVVAVVDGGVDAEHPDLVGSVLPGYDVLDPGGDAGVDLDGHGTHVAGVIAAHQGDGIGIAGLRPGTRILPVRVLDENGDGFASDVADGIVLATDGGADVINLSLGGPGRSLVVQDAVEYALAQGVSVVVSSGNSRQDGDPVMYPAAQAGVVAVGASERSGLVAPYSSTGSHVAVTAPGTDVLSSVPGGWALSSGTSMAAPHVSAVVAAMLAVDPDLTPAQVRSTLVRTAADLAPAGRDDASGAGLVRPVAALRSLGADPVAVPGEPVPGTGLPRDADGDGRTDLFAVSSDGSLLRYRSDGAGGVAGRSVAGTGWNGVDLVTAVGDWDRDGFADLVARRRADAALVLYRGDGRGGWRGTRVLGSRWSDVDTLLSPSDWDGDGRSDLLARRASDGALVLYSSASDGSLRPARVIGSRWGGVTALVVLGDWDGDGAPDLAAREASGRLVLYPGEGTGRFGVPTTLGTGWAGIGSLAGPGDWDGDRRPDVLAVTSDGQLRVYSCDGTGGFAGARTTGRGWSGLRLVG